MRIHARIPKRTVTIMVYLIGLFFVLTVLALIIGLAGFAQGGEFNRKYGNKMMRFRIMFQFVAVVLGLMLVAMSARK